MNLMKSVVLTLVVGGFGFAAAVQGQTKGEKVELKTLPSPVQKTINEKAAGGKIPPYVEKSAEAPASEPANGPAGGGK